MRDGRRYHETNRPEPTLRQEFMQLVWLAIILLTGFAFLLVAGGPVPVR
jgi:hypothetical protein